MKIEINHQLDEDDKKKIAKVLSLNDYKLELGFQKNLILIHLLELLPGSKKELVDTFIIKKMDSNKNLASFLEIVKENQNKPLPYSFIENYILKTDGELKYRNIPEILYELGFIGSIKRAFFPKVKGVRKTLHFRDEVSKEQLIIENPSFTYGGLLNTLVARDSGIDILPTLRQYKKQTQSTSF